MKLNLKHAKSYCKKRVPGPVVLFQRYDAVCNLFGNIKDALSEEPLFRANTLKQVANLRKHIEDGCLFDPRYTYSLLYSIF